MKIIKWITVKLIWICLYLSIFWVCWILFNAQTGLLHRDTNTSQTASQAHRDVSSPQEGQSLGVSLRTPQRASQELPEEVLVWAESYEKVCLGWDGPEEYLAAKELGVCELLR